MQEPAAEPRLPLPGGPEPFAKLVDAYVSYHKVTKAETFRRISAETGNSPKGISLRYYERSDQPWWIAVPSPGTEELDRLDPELQAAMGEHRPAVAAVQEKPALGTRQDPDDLVMATMFIARCVRDAMEDFHCEHLTDDQMAKLNPLVREGIIEGLFLLARLGSPDAELRAGAAATMAFKAPPGYWEPPEIPDLDETLRGFAQAVASGMLDLGSS
jgi:hypothetical protein